MSDFYIARIASGVHLVAESISSVAYALSRLADIEEKKLSAREEYLSHLTPAERLHEDGLPDEDWVLDRDQQPKLVQKPGDEDEKTD